MSRVRCLGAGFCFSVPLSGLPSQLSLALRLDTKRIIFPFWGFLGIQRVSFLLTDLLLVGGKKNVRITPAVIALKDTVRPPNWTPSLAPLGQYTYYNRFRQGGHSADVCLGVSTCISVPAEVSGGFHISHFGLWKLHLH